MGVFEEIDLDQGEVEWGEYMCIQVHLDVIKPLLRQKKLNIASYPKAWLRFSNERLLDLCYCCEIMGHNHWECVKWEESKEACKQDGFPYDSWLRARQTENNGSKILVQSSPRERDTKLPLDNAKIVNLRREIEALRMMVDVTIDHEGNKDAIEAFSR